MIVCSCNVLSDQDVRMALTAEQFRDYFSPTAQDYGRTLGLLAAQGFTISRTYANRSVIDVTAPAALVERVVTKAAARAGTRISP